MVDSVSFQIVKIVGDEGANPDKQHRNGLPEAHAEIIGSRQKRYKDREKTKERGIESRELSERKQMPHDNSQLSCCFECRDSLALCLRPSVTLVRRQWVGCAEVFVGRLTGR
jgi:hypothetical protein